MNITLKARDLVGLLARIDRVVEARNTIPILSNALLSARDGALEITGTDLDMSIALHESAVDVETEGDVTAPAQTLRDIAKRLPADAQVRLETSDGQLIVRSGRARFMLAALPVADFPNTKGMMRDARARAAMPGAVLAGALARLDYAISSEETRYYLNGVYLVAHESALRGVATNGHCLAQVSIEAGDMAGDFGVILPRKACGVVRALAMEGPAKSSVMISTDGSAFRMEWDGGCLTSKLIDGTFPDYARVIPTGNDRTARLDCAQLKALVERVGVIAEKSRGIALDFEADQLKCEVTSPDLGSATDTIECAYDAAPLRIGMNGRYILETLTAIADEGVLISMADSGAPALFRPRSASDFLAVVMPMRV